MGVCSFDPVSSTSLSTAMSVAALLFEVDARVALVPLRFRWSINGVNLGLAGGLSIKTPWDRRVGDTDARGEVLDDLDSGLPRPSRTSELKDNVQGREIAYLAYQNTNLTLGDLLRILNRCLQVEAVRWQRHLFEGCREMRPAWGSHDD